VARGRLGWAVAGGDVDGDGAIDLVVSAPEADIDGIGVGAVYVFDGALRGVRYPDAARARVDR
ncbi:MAG: integrin alpha, partial [Myxococcota bacterium]